MKHIGSIFLAVLTAIGFPVVSGAGEGDPPGEIGDIGYQESYYLGGGWGPLPGVWRPGHAGLFVGGTLDGSMRFIESNVESAYSIKAIYEDTLSDWTSPHYDSRAGEDMDYMGAKTHNPLPTPAQRLEICSYAMAKLDLPISYFDGNGQNPKGQYTHPSADDLTSAGYANEQEYIDDDIWLYDNYNEFWCVGFCERAYEHAGLNPTTDESDNWHFFLFTVPMQWNGENVQWASAVPPKVISKTYSTARNTDIVVTFAGENFASTAFAGNVTVVGSSSGSHGASLAYNASTYQLTINPTTDFSYGETVTVTLTTGIKDLANNALDGDGNGTPGPNHVFSFTIQSSPPGPRTSINITSLTLDPSTVDPYGSFEVRGNASYNNGELVNDGTARIVVQDGSTYTIAVTGGAFSRYCQAPGNNGTSQISKNVTVTVSDGVVTQDTETRTLTVRGQGGTSYDLDTSIVYDWEGDDSSVSYSSKDAFRTTDEKVDLIGVFDNMSGSGWLDLKWRCFRPDGTQYGSDLVENDALNLEWGWGWWAWGWLISGQSMAYNPGKYRMDFFVNNDRKATHYFVVAWDFTQHYLCKDFDGSWQPINQGNIFSPSDTRAVALHHFEYRAQGLDVKTEFYAPGGGLYATESYSFADDLGPHEWQGWSRNAAWIWINGYNAAYMCGDWTVKFYVKNPTSAAWEQKYTDYFRIQESTAPSVSVAASPSSPIETQSISLNISASDNNHLKKVTVHWNDGTWHENSWDNINASSWNGSQSVGSGVAAGETVEFWCETWDESSNRSESSRQSIVVQAETVSTPSRPSGPETGLPGETLSYSTAASSTTLGAPVEYQYDWGDGQTSGWGSVSASHAWSIQGTYPVRVHARSQPRPDRESAWSSTLMLEIEGLKITTVVLPAGMEMVPYNATLQATNGTPPYTWSVSEGYAESSQANSFSAVGTAQGWHADDNCWSVSIPFDFPFHGNNRNTLYINSNGTITFDGYLSQFWVDFDTFRQREMISALWADLSTYDPDDIRVEVGADQATVYWDGHYLGGDKVNVSATLTSDGTVTLRYGSGNANGGMIGVSAGDGQNYLLSGKSQSGSMESAADIMFAPAGRLPEGLSCSTNGVVSGTPTLAATSVVTFVVQDSVGASTNKPIEIAVAPNPNTRPVITSNAPPTGAFSMGEATSQLFRVWAYDPEGSNLTYSWTWDGAPVGGNASTYTHTTAWGDAGEYVLRCYVSDDLWQNIVYSQWAVTVLDDNDGDGMPNWQELDLGRNPNDPSDAGNTSTLAGTVRGGGVGLSDAYVELRGAGGTTYHRTLTASDGTYVLYSVLPGHYYAKAGAERFADEWYDNATHRTSAVPYSVPADSIIGGFDFDLAPGQNPALVEVTSDPAGATVYLDYQVTAEVTPAILNVGEVGDWDWTGYRIASHVITVKKAGRPRPSPRPVAAKEAETVSLHFDMTSDAIGSVSVATIPDGTTVYIDYADSADGISPVVVGNLAPGSHVILLKQTGYLQPRPVVAWAQEGLTNEVSVPMTVNTAPDRLIANARSVPPGATVYVDYLPTTNVTDVVVDWMDPASHAGSGWHSASHTIMLRKSGFLPAAPRYVPDRTNETQTIVVHLIGDSVTAVDEDHDGLPDQWEDAYRLRELAPGQHGPNDDPDNDGVPNNDEMGAGTNPLDGNSCLSVTDLTVSTPGPGQTVTFIFDTVPGRTYIVQCTDELKSGWTNLSGLILATADQTAYTTQIPEGTAHQFYRLIVLTP